MLSLTVPAFNFSPNLVRTIDSCKPYVDEVIIVATALYDDDLPALMEAGKVVQLPWNYVFHNGYGSLYNAGSAVAPGWQVLLGVSETILQPYIDMRSVLSRSSKSNVYYCDHINDPNKWGRIWNHTGGTAWSGVIHETIVGGHNAGLAFEMRDTDKTPHPDPYRNETFKYIKGLSYNHLYLKLHKNPGLIGGTHPAWHKFILGAMDGITSYLTKHADLLEPVLSGDKQLFLDRVKAKVDEGMKASGVKFEPVGQPATGEETIKSGN